MASEISDYRFSTEPLHYAQFTEFASSYPNLYTKNTSRSGTNSICKMQLSTKSPESGIRKRRRPAHSCVECRRRKVRCDRANPCSQCVAHNAPSCTFTDNRRITSDHNLRESQATKQQEHRTSIIPDGSPSSNISPPTPAPSGRIHGTQSKTRVFGQGHWMSTKRLVSDGLFLFRMVGPLLTAHPRPPNCPF